MHTMNRRCGERRRSRGLAGQRTPHAPRATCEESAGWAAAWSGFEPTRRAKLAARTASGPDGARNTGGAASRNTGGAASNNTGEAATASSIEDSGPAPS